MMEEPLDPQLKEKDPELRCKSRFASMRCMLRAGHQGEHRHDGAGGNIGWGIRVRKRG